MQQAWIKKWDILENITIEKLVFWGKWFARLSHSNPDLDGRVIFVTWGAIPGTIANLKVLKKKKAFLETQIVDIIKKSDIEKTHPTNKYGMSWWWKWINIPYDEQLKIKQEQVKEALNILKDKIFKESIPSSLHSEVLPLQKEEINELYENLFLPIEWSPIVDGYRNKVEFSYWKYISHKFWIEEHFNVWFHKQWEFSKVEDFYWAPLIDETQNEIYREMKKFSKTLWLPVYDQMRQEGFFRHILIRKTHFTNQMMILLSFNPEYLSPPPSPLPSKEGEDKSSFRKWQLEKIRTFFIGLSKKYPIIKSIYFSHNPNKADVCIWDLELIYWENIIQEELHGLSFNISPTSFFQTNSSWAEKLYDLVLDFANKDNLSNETVLDLYGWTGTIGMIFAKHWAKDVISVELVTSASKDWEKNAELNGLCHISFVNKKVEDFLNDYISDWNTADLLVIDPPRAWMHPDALPNILKFNTNQIIYVSCNPATLARDLWYILDNSDYKIEKVQAMDMFPHTHHIETIVSLVK